LGWVKRSLERGGNVSPALYFGGKGKSDTFVRLSRF
jgi:hypothetical protein